MNKKLYKNFNNLIFGFFYPAILGFMLIEFFRSGLTFKDHELWLAIIVFFYFCTQYIEVEDSELLHNTNKREDFGRIIINLIEGILFLTIAHLLFVTEFEDTSKFDCHCVLNCNDPELAAAYLCLSIAFLLPVLRRFKFSQSSSNFVEGNEKKATLELSLIHI